MIYNLSMFGTKMLAVTVNELWRQLNYDRKLWRHWYLGNGGLRKMWWDGFQNCFTDDFEAIKNGITLVARFLQYFPCLYPCYTSSRPEVFCKNSIKFCNIHRKKNLCWSLFFNKVASFRSATLLKKRLAISLKL